MALRPSVASLRCDGAVGSREPGTLVASVKGAHVLTETETFGANSEVGELHTVMVHRPDLAHERLSPSNCHELLFDDVIWVRHARQEFDAFVDTMRSHGVEVLLLHELLVETLEEA